MGLFTHPERSKTHTDTLKPEQKTRNKPLWRKEFQNKGFCKMLLFDVTYMSSLVWRSIGSWVSLSMWKRTSKEDSVNALKDNGTQITIPLKYSHFKYIVVIINNLRIYMIINNNLRPQFIFISPNFF